MKTLTSEEWSAWVKHHFGVDVESLPESSFAIMRERENMMIDSMINDRQIDQPLDVGIDLGHHDRTVIVFRPRKAGVTQALREAIERIRQEHPDADVWIAGEEARPLVVDPRPFEEGMRKASAALEEFGKALAKADEHQARSAGWAAPDRARDSRFRERPGKRGKR